MRGQDGLATAGEPPALRYYGQLEMRWKLM